MSITFRIYTHVMGLDDDERDRLKALVEGSELAPAHKRDRARAGRVAGFGSVGSGRYRVRTSDLLLVRQALSQLS